VEEPRVGVKVSGKPGPFVFDFEIPVRPAPTIEVNQRVEAEGVAPTLRRVVASRWIVCRLGGARGLRLSLLLVVLGPAYPAHHAPRVEVAGELIVIAVARYHHDDAPVVYVFGVDGG
jgi:hypothetical protein